MAWPATPIASFVNGSAPPVDDTFLNTLQSGVNQLCTGAVSHAGVVIDAVGGVATSSAGQLVVGASSSGTAPLVTFKDQLGGVRGFYDHLGYRRGRIREVVFDFLEVSGATINGAVTSTGANRLQYALALNANLGGASGSTFPGAQYVILGQGGTVANGQTSRLFSGAFFAPAAYTSLVMEFELLTVTSGWDIKVGLQGSPSTASATPSGSETSIGIVKQNADTQYYLSMGAGGAAVKYPTAVTPAAGAGPPDRFTVELHGASSPYGAKQRVYINEVLVIDANQATAPTNVSVGMGLVVAMTTVSATNSSSPGCQVSPVRVVWNTALSIPTV